jgi:1,5-anhydro-D-fructose reductase (1,5-anhydro-D-mannitol-forming)
MTDKLRWGVVGATTIGREWMIGAMREADGEVVCLMSSDAARGAAYARETGIPRATTDLGELLGSGIDAVYIATTNERHRAQTLAAAAAGKHVLCEKPLALTLADAREMVAACRKAGVVMGTNHHLRNAATIRALRDAVAQGRIGKALFARVFHAVFLPPHLQGWRIKDAAAGSGAVMDITVHDADTLRFVLGDEPVAVTAMTQQGFEVHGSEGSLIGTGCMTQRPVGEVVLRNAQGETALTIDHENLYVRSVTAFQKAVRGEGAPAATGEDGIRSMALALAALDSARTGREAPVEPGI